MGAIISAIISGLIGAILGIIEKKQAKQNEYAARALEVQKASIVEGAKLEAAVESAQAAVPVPKTSDDLKNMLGLQGAFLVCALLTLTGCFEMRVTVDQYKPVLKTKKPTAAMVEGPVELTPREQAMGQYVGQLRAAVGAYNYAARESNRRGGYPEMPEPPDSGYEVLLTVPVTPSEPEHKPAPRQPGNINADVPTPLPLPLAEVVNLDG